MPKKHLTSKKLTINRVLIMKIICDDSSLNILYLFSAGDADISNILGGMSQQQLMQLLGRFCSFLVSKD